MKIEEILKERVCPSCEENRAEVYFTMVKEQFLYNNPTHNLDWFKKIEIADDYKFPFLKCKSCDFVYSKYRLNDKYNFEFYNQGIRIEKSREKIFKKAKRVQQTEIWLRMLKLYVDKPQLKLLDYGGGWGDFLAIAKSYGVQAFGLEFDQRKIEYAKENGILLDDLAFIERHAPYDLFMCNQVMEHLDEPKKSLRFLRSLLLTGAVGFMGVPNFNDNYLNRNIKLIKEGGIPPKEINPFGHLNYFSPRTFKRMLEETGFEILHDQKNATPERPLRSLVRKIFRRAKKKQNEENGNLFYVKAV